jgi:PLD-like domain
LSKTRFLSDDAWATISELARNAKSRHAAVAYIGSDALDMLPLGKDDTLIVDLSDGTVKSGSTNPSVIRRYYQKGVQVFSCQGLHAKVFVFGNKAVIGSTNVSSNSRDVLTEAAVVTSDPSIVASCRQFIKEIQEQLIPLNDKQIQQSEKLYRKPKWQPGSGVPTHQTKAHWAYRVIQELKLPVGHRKRHGHFIDLDGSSKSVATAYLVLDPADHGIGTARLDLYPADIVTQARAFYPIVEAGRLMALTDKGWEINANLHFGNTHGKGLPPHVNHRSVPKYIEYWRTNENDIGRFDQSDLRGRIKSLRKANIVPRNQSRQASLPKFASESRKHFAPGATP